MSLAVIYWSDGYMQRLRDEDKATALEAYWAWRRRLEGATGDIVKRVTLPTSWQPVDYESAIVPQEPDTTHLTNPGISQSMYDALPRNDR